MAFERERARVKRTRTYTGCWTCRLRGVKCDERRPTCRTCQKSRLACGGYHVKLAWAHETGETDTPSERRTILAASDMNRPVLDPREIRHFLNALDTIEPPAAVHMGPFSVFPALGTGESPPSAYPETGASPGSTDATDSTEAGETETEAMAMWSIKQKLAPHLTTYVSSATLEERSLLHYWVTYVSGLMTPTQRLDNPFRTIFIPLALAAPSVASCASTALLHAIYALSACNRAQLCVAGERDQVLGSKHHQACLRHLRQSLLCPDESQNEAILATLIAVLSLDAFNGSSASWRAHLANGSAWLHPRRHAVATQSPSAAILCQIFSGMQVLATTADGTAPLPRDSAARAGSLDTADGPCSAWVGALDVQFGTTRQILEGIARTNDLSSVASSHGNRTDRRPVTDSEIDALDNFIRRNDPDLMVADMDGDGDDTIVRHHMAAFFCASLIHFERRVRKTPPAKLQRLVQRSLGHLESIRALERENDWAVCGIFWPLFVTVCEAEDVCNLRGRALALCAKGKLRGIRNIALGEEVVREVWNRREHGNGSDVSWDSTMADLGLDLLLA